MAYSGTTDGNGSGSVEFRQQQNDFYKTYDSLPEWCRHPDVWEATKAGDAGWTHSLQGDLLHVTMRVRSKGLVSFSGNNWIGVGLRCKP